MYDQYPVHDVPQNNLIQRFFAQRWSAIALEIVMTIVITIAAGAAFDFFDPLDGVEKTSADAAHNASGTVEIEGLTTSDPLQFIKQTGAARIRERRFAAGEAIFAWAIALAPEDVESYAWRGYANMQAGDYVEAQADYGKVLELKPADFAGHSALCWAFGETEQYDQAKAHCQLALQNAGNRTNYAIALENWCWLRVETGAYDEAAKTCRFSLEYAPEYEEARALANYNLARVLVAQGRTREALPHFAEALRIGSSYLKMYLEIGRIYDTLGNHSAAQASYVKYRELSGLRDASVGQADG